MPSSLESKGIPADKSKSRGETDSIAGSLRKRHISLLKERSSWVPDWRILAEHFYPRRFRALDEEGTSKTNEPGLTDRLVDNESIRARRVLAAGMQGGMTSPARPWFRLGVPDPELEESILVKEWLSEVQRIILNVMARSNFYDAIHELYSDLGTFGTGCIFALEDFEDIVRYRTLTTGEYCLIAGANGRIQGVFRIIDMTAEQVVERFGTEKVSSNIRTEAGKDGNKDKWFQIVHAVLPNKKRDPSRIGADSMAYESFYYEYTGDTGQTQPELLSRGGFDEKPFAGPRWSVVGSDIYGTGPATDSLNDVRALQSMVSTFMKAVHKQADPPVVAPANFWDVNTIPGGINYIDTQNKDGLRALYNVNFDAQGTAAMIQEMKEAIREGLYNDLFRMLALAERGNMTLGEVKERIEEKLIMLGPVIERLHSELLDVLIDRTFAICLRRGMFPPPPEELEGGELRVEYISLLAQAQKLVGTSAIDAFMGLVGTYAELFPEMADIPDIDEVGESYAELVGLDPKMVRSREEREARREAKAQALQQQAQMEQAVQGAKALKDVSDSDIQGDDTGGGLV